MIRDFVKIAGAYADNASGIRRAMFAAVATILIAGAAVGAAIVLFVWRLSQ